MEKCLIVSLLENRRGLMFKPFCGPCIYTSGSLWNRLLDEGIASLSAASFLWQAKRNVKKNTYFGAKKIPQHKIVTSFLAPSTCTLWHPVDGCPETGLDGPSIAKFKFALFSVFWKFRDWVTSLAFVLYGNRRKFLFCGDCLGKRLVLTGSISTKAFLTFETRPYAVCGYLQ